MDTREFTDHLLRNFHPPPPGEVLEAAEMLSVDYLQHLMVMHKFHQVYGGDTPLGRVEMLLTTRILDGFVTGAHLLRSRFYNAALTEMRAVHETLNVLRWVTLCEPALELYLANDPVAIRREFSPSRVSQGLGATPWDAVHRFLRGYSTHPFYTNREYLLQVDLTEPGDIEPPKSTHYPALDAVGGSIILLSYCYTTWAMGTNYGLAPIVEKDRDSLDRMFKEVEGFLKACEKVMGEHRGIHTVIENFRKQFPRLYKKSEEARQNDLYARMQRARQLYSEGRLPFPPLDVPARVPGAFAIDTGSNPRIPIPPESNRSRAADASESGDMDPTPVSSRQPGGSSGAWEIYRQAAAATADESSDTQTESGSLPAAPDDMRPPPPSGF